MTLHVQESYLNATEGYRFGDSPVIDTELDTPGEVYRYAQKEYGRCISKVYIDTPDGPRAIGWVFQSRQQYEDAKSASDTYIREVWVTLHTEPDTVTRTTHYHYL